MKVSTINPTPTEEVILFAKSKKATAIAVWSYCIEDGVIWACYDDYKRCLGICDATGAEQ